jgi:hypothetical protein
VTAADQPVVRCGHHPETLDSRPRITIAAQEFSAEITATVLWLRTILLDGSCVRLVRYRGTSGSPVSVERPHEWLPAGRDTADKVSNGAIAHRAHSDRAWVTWISTKRRSLRSPATGVEAR